MYCVLGGWYPIAWKAPDHDDIDDHDKHFLTLCRLTTMPSEIIPKLKLFSLSFIIANQKRPQIWTGRERRGVGQRRENKKMSPRGRIAFLFFFFFFFPLFPKFFPL